MGVTDMVWGVSLQRMYSAIIRQHVLIVWKNRKGLDATYKNLLELFLKAGHTECADTICTVLKRRGEDIHYHILFPRSEVYITTI